MGGREKGHEQGRKGRGMTTTLVVVVPPSSCRQWGVACVAHTPPYSHSFTPPLLGGSLTRGPVYHPHAAPRLASFIPLVGGCFFLRHQRRRGRRVDYTLPPFYFLFCSPLWGSFFPVGEEAACNPHTASISLRPPPSFGRGFLIHSPPLHQENAF